MLQLLLLLLPLVSSLLQLLVLQLLLLLLLNLLRPALLRPRILSLLLPVFAPVEVTTDNGIVQRGQHVIVQAANAPPYSGRGTGIPPASERSGLAQRRRHQILHPRGSHAALLLLLLLLLLVLSRRQNSFEHSSSSAARRRRGRSSARCGGYARTAR